MSSSSTSSESDRILKGIADAASRLAGRVLVVAVSRRMTRRVAMEIKRDAADLTTKLEEMVRWADTKIGR